MINGNAVGGIVGYGKTFVITDENGNELTGVVVDEEVIFTADPVTDIRDGKVAATDAGVVTGLKNIPSYHTGCGYKIVLANKEASILTKECNYSNLSVTISSYDTSAANSVVATYVSVDGKMYETGSGNKISDITIDEINQKINLGIIVTEKSVVRYFVMREEF